MAKLHFLLKEKNNPVSTLILVVFRIKNEKIVRSTREFINPMDWNFDEQLPVVKKKRADLAELRNRLTQLRLTIETELIKLRGVYRHEPKSEVDRIIRDALGIKENDNSTMSVRQFVDQYMTTGLREDSVKLLRSFVSTFNKFCPEAKINDLNKHSYTNFISYLEDTGGRQNTIRNYTGAFKRVVRAVEKEFGSVSFDVNNLKSPSFEKSYKLALSVSELESLYKSRLMFDELTRRCVEFFLVVAFTGIRKRDAFTSGKINFDSEGLYVKDTSKTGERVVVPQHWIVKEIIGDNGGFVIPDASDVTIVQKVRDVAAMAGITEDFYTTVTKGGQKRVIIKKRYEAISFHTARRSFATNLHKSGVPVKVCMLFTGHKTMQQFMDYIMIDKLDNANAYKAHSFFTGDK